ncbi:MAG: response regulator transcription factor [Coriobacteriia bacterium]
MTVTLQHRGERDAASANLNVTGYRRSRLIWLFGVGPLWTLWLQMGLIGSPGFYSVGGASVPDHTYSIVVYGLFALQWLIVALFGKKLVRLHERRALLIGAAVVSAVGMVASRGAQSGRIDDFWVIPGLFLLGAALVPLFLVWAELYGVLGPRLTGISISGSLLLCVALYWALSSLALSTGGIAATALLVCLPILSCVSALMSWRVFSDLVPAKKAEQVRRFRMPATIMGLVAAYGVALGLILGFLFFTPNLGPQAVFTWLGPRANLAQAICVGIVAVALLCSILFSRSWNLSRNYWPILPLVVAGFLLLPILHVDQRYLALDVALAGWAYCRVLMVTICSEMVGRLSLPASTIFGWDRFANDAGVAVGLLAQAAIAKTLPHSDSYFSIITLVVVILLVLVNTFLLKEARVQSLWGLDPASSAPMAPSAPTPIEERCAVVAAAKQLTPREGEIMAMLAMGRNTDYIRKALCLSSNTVRAHTTHIYSKLGVHSRQDLIDLVQKHD